MKIRFAVSPGSAAAGGAGILAFADAIERGGFDGIWLSDVPLAPTLDPLLGLALVAGRTSRLRLGANVVPLGRNPFLLAKELAQLDRVSHGRLLLSFVTGLGQKAERNALGLGNAGRGDVLEEVLGLLRAWWAGSTVAHQSERWSFGDVEPVVRPLQDPLEVWLGGRGPKALDRVGRVADGWLGAQVTAPEARVARERIQAVASHAAREFDPEHFGLSIPYTRARPEAELLATLTARRPDTDPLTIIAVGKEGLRRAIHDYVEAGLSKFVVRPGGAVESWEDESEWLADAILDLQT
jgi:probable F420-dependent oxidoreductase